MAVPPRSITFSDACSPKRGWCYAGGRQSSSLGIWFRSDDLAVSYSPFVLKSTALSFGIRFHTSNPPFRPFIAKSLDLYCTTTDSLKSLDKVTGRGGE